MMLTNDAFSTHQHTNKLVSDPLAVRPLTQQGARRWFRKSSDFRMIS